MQPALCKQSDTKAPGIANTVFQELNMVIYLEYLAELVPTV